MLAVCVGSVFWLLSLCVGYVTCRVAVLSFLALFVDSRSNACWLKHGLGTKMHLGWILLGLFPW